MTPPKTKTSDYITWNDCIKIEKKLLDAKQYRIYLYLSMGRNFGLRAKDMLSLKWADVMSKKFLSLTESKTGKIRKIDIVDDTQNAIQTVFKIINPDKDEFIFKSWSTKGVMSSQYISKKLRYYAAPIVGFDKHISTHSTRKTLGRRVLNTSENKEYALIMLNEIFNHENMGTTRRYLGILAEEKSKIYQSMYRPIKQ